MRIRIQGSGFRVQGTGERGKRLEVRGRRSEVSQRPHHSPLTTHSPLRHRPGVTLLEVLFSIMVASVGLLGALSVIPAALSQAKKGQKADITAVGANSAVAAFDAALMRRPDRWLASAGVVNNVSVTTFLPTAFSTASANNVLFGRAFCIDPRFFEQNRLEDTQQNMDNSSVWGSFPAVPTSQVTYGSSTTGGRMLRLTLHSNSPFAPTDPAARMSLLQADKVFHIEDELKYQRPADNSLAAVQLYNQMQTSAGPPATFVASRRQEEGRLSWMATLVPKLDRLSGQIGEEYVLSIVIFYQRSPDMHVPSAASPDAHPWIEWTAKILGPNTVNAAGDYHASGIGGGEVTITTNDQNGFTAAPGSLPLPDQLNAIARGSWVCLGTQASTSGGNQPVQVFQWYRVSDTGEDAQPVTVGGVQRYQRDVTLIGPDWPADITGDGIADQCDVIIVPQVVYVYERTIKIDTGAAP